MDAILANMFIDSRFNQFSPRCYIANIDGKRVGAVLATMNVSFDTFALNVNELKRLRDAKDVGKIDAAHVVAAKIDAGTPTFTAAMTIEEVDQRLNGYQPRNGRLGEFFALPRNFFPPGDDVPF